MSVIPTIPGPRITLARLPVPVQELPELCPLEEVRLFAKREDLSADRYGGNKVRKLEHLLARAREHGGPLLTVGAAGSHHLLATACFGQQQGIEVHALVGPQPDSPHARDNARALAGLAAGLWPVPHWVRLPEVMAQAVATLSARSHHAPFLVPAGGSSVDGCLGAVSLGLELGQDVIAGRIPPPDHVVVPVGIGGTAVGLWVGLRAMGLPTTVVGVRTTPRLMATGPQLRALAGSVLRRMHLRPTVPLRVNPLQLVHDQVGAGYGSPTPQGIEAARLAFERGGLQLEQTYSAKAMAACLHAIRQHELGGVVVFVATASSRPMGPLLADAPATLPPALDALLCPSTDLP